MKQIICIALLMTSLLPSYTQEFNQAELKKPYVCSIRKEKIIYSENFKSDLSNWKVEFEKPDSSTIQIIDGKLDIRTSHGATIWFKPKLTANVMIIYDVTVIFNGGVNERVSDLNAFWMATDPDNDKEIIRNGRFTSYDNLNLYYAGVGGHNNKFTRFRKYRNDGFKPVLQEYTDSAHLLQGNTEYQVKIIVHNGLIRYLINDELFWEMIDTKPYTEGFFGFRTTQSHQQFDNFMVLQIE